MEIVMQMVHYIPCQSGPSFKQQQKFNILFASRGISSNLLASQDDIFKNCKGKLYPLSIKATFSAIAKVDYASCRSRRCFQQLQRLTTILGNQKQHYHKLWGVNYIPKQSRPRYHTLQRLTTTLITLSKSAE